MPSTPRLALALCGLAGAVPLVGLLVGGADAQDPTTAAAPPQVTLAVSAPRHPVTVTGAEALSPGPTTISVRSTSAKEDDLAIVGLKPGVTQAQFEAAVAKLKGPPSSLLGLSDFVMGSATSKASRTYTATTTLKATTYLVYDVSSDTAPPKLVASFAVTGAGAPATAPTADATVRLDDFAFHPSGTLPSTGVVRFVNEGPSPHFAVMAGVRTASDGRKALKLLKAGKEQAAMELISGAPSEPLGLVSPGVTDDVAFEGVKPGSYVLACFYGDKRSHGKEHTMLGMERLVTVR